MRTITNIDFKFIELPSQRGLQNDVATGFHQSETVILYAKAYQRLLTLNSYSLYRVIIILKTNLMGTIWSQFKDGKNRSTSNMYKALFA